MAPHHVTEHTVSLKNLRIKLALKVDGNEKLGSSKGRQQLNFSPALWRSRVILHLNVSFLCKQFISWIGEADQICRMTIRFTLDRLFKMLIVSANTIGAVIRDRNNLTPLRQIVMTMPIQKAVTSGNGNIAFYRESTHSNCK